MNKSNLKKLITENIIPNKEQALILFYSNNCVHCGEIKEHLNKLVENKKIHYFQIEEFEDYDSGQELSSLFEVNYFPTLVQINKGGYKVHVGVKKIKQVII